jgi:hypothetical protein
MIREIIKWASLVKMIIGDFRGFELKEGGFYIPHEISIIKNKSL